jgi:hypothetical protein
MSDTTRSKMIRLAATMPAGSSERKALLKVLASGGASARAAELLPYDYDSLTIGVKTGTKTPDGMDRWDNHTIPIGKNFKGTKADLESAMLRIGSRHPKQIVKLYGHGSGVLDSLVLWTPGRGFEAPDYLWESSNLRRSTRPDVARWISGRGPNPALPTS